MSRSRYIVVGLVCAAIILAFENTGILSPEGDPGYKEAQQLLASFPVYPDSKEVGSSGKLLWGHASVGKRYESTVSYVDLKSFYLDVLTRSGWRLVEERHLSDWWEDLGRYELTFRKGGDKVSIEYAGRKADDGWDYGVSLEHSFE